MPSRYRSISTIVRCLGVLAGASASLPAHAQLEEVVVTAERRETVLQRTPMSIHALTGEELQRSGIDQGRDLGIMVPNVVLNSRGIGSGDLGTYYIRGLPGVGIYVDGVWQGERGFLDTHFVGVDRVEVLRGPQGTLFGRNTNGGAVNIVTQTPGDAFSGRLTLRAGEFDRRDAALSIDWPISATVRTRWTAGRFTNGGFLESLTAGRSLGGQDDALLRGDLLFEPTSRLELRVILADEETKTSDARIIRFTNTTHPRYLAYNILAGNPDFLAAARAIDPEFPDPPKALPADRFTPESHQTGYPGGELGKWQTKSTTAADGMAYDIVSATLRLRFLVSEHFGLESITADRKMSRRSRTDRDGSEFTISGLELRTRQLDLSQEIHFFGSHLDGRIDWLAGLYYLNEEIIDRRHSWLMWEFVIPNEGPESPLLDPAAVGYVRDYGSLLGISALAPAQGPGGPLGGFEPLVEETSDELTGSVDRDRAAFGEVTVRATQRLDLTFGLRVTGHDGWLTTYTPTDGFRPAAEQLAVRGDPFAGVVDTETADPDAGDVVTHKLVATYRWSDDLMIYASYAEGFSSGEIAISRFLSEPIVLDPEIVSTRELGLRSAWLDDRLRFNATYFASTWDGMRVPILPDDPRNPGQKLPSPVLTSEGLAKTDGWELELAWSPSERWRMSAAVGLLDARYLDIGDSDPTGVNGIQPDSPFAYAPKRSAALSALHLQPLAGGGQLSLAANYGWMDGYARAAANQWTPQDAQGRPLLEPAYGILNASVRFEPAVLPLSFEFWGRNLTDEWYVNGGIDARTVWGFDFATIGAAREVGIGVDYRF